MQYGLSLCLRRLGKSFGIYVRVCFCLPVRHQTEWGRKRGPFGGGGLQPDPAAVPQRKVVPALLSGEGKNKGEHLFSPDPWGHGLVQLLDLQVCRGYVTGRLCVFVPKPTGVSASIQKPNTHSQGGQFIQQAAVCLAATVSQSRPSLIVCEQMIFNRAGRAARHVLQPGSYQ